MIKHNIGNFIHWVVLLGIIVAGFYIRAYQLTKHDFWLDEVLTHEFVSGKLSAKEEVVINKFLEKNPPTYYIVLRSWAYFFGNTEYSLRFFSVVCSILCVLMIYKVGNVCFGRSGALIAAFLMAFSPFHVWYSQEARGFTFSVLLVLIQVYFFMRLLLEQRVGTRILVGYFMSLTGAICTTYYSFLLLVPQAVMVLWLKRKFFLRWSGLVLSAFAVFALFLLPRIVDQMFSFKENPWFRSPHSLSHVLLTIDNFVLGYNGDYYLYLVSRCVLVFVACLACIRKQWYLICIVFLSAVVPLLLAFYFSKWFFPVYLHRHLVIFSPFLYLFIAGTLHCIKHRLVSVSVIVAFVGVFAGGLLHYQEDIVSAEHMRPGAYIKKDVRSFVQFFLHRREHGDGVGYANHGFARTVRYYLEQLAGDYPSIPQFHFYKHREDSYFEEKIKIMQRFDIERVRHVNIEQDTIRDYSLERIWLFSTSWERDGRLAGNDLAVKRWFDGHFIKLREWYMDGVWIGLYEIG